MNLVSQCDREHGRISNAYMPMLACLTCPSTGQTATLSITMPSSPSSSSSSCCPSPAVHRQQQQHQQQHTVTVDSEDSSYDSDQEATPAPAHRPLQRAVSDTLSAEFSEYLTLATPATSVGAAGNYCYDERLRLAAKLGYSERHVQCALAALPGSDNEFVQQLVAAAGRELVAPPQDDVSRPLVATTATSALRHIVIDGSNVAMSHGNREVFSCRGIQLAVEYFRSRGHTAITAFVPMWRKEAARADSPIIDQHLLLQMERERALVFTPSRVVDGKRITCYDDRYILQTAVDEDGIVVSNDNYRDLYRDNALFKQVVERRLLMYSFVNDRFMPPEDPLGRSGPKLDAFLRHASRNASDVCPYGKKCTYGLKCKYYHPERVSGGATVRPSSNCSATSSLSCQRAAPPPSSEDTKRRPIRHKTLSLPAAAVVASAGPAHKRKVTRTRSLAASGAAPVVASPISAGGWVSPPLSPPSVQPEQQQQQQQQHHRRLARQLTLNPTHDERLVAHQLMTFPNHHHHHHHHPPNQPPPQYLFHHNQQKIQQQPQVNHAEVVRIASAPVLFAGGSHALHLLSPAALPPPPASTPAAAAAAVHSSAFGPSSEASSSSLEAAAARDRVWWHLTALFDETSVRQALARLPAAAHADATAVCAVILQQQQQQQRQH